MTSEQTVDDSAANEGERKTVTALFADIKGSMELMEGYAKPAMRQSRPASA
jgi:hypothetical protein